MGLKIWIVSYAVVWVIIANGGNRFIRIVCRGDWLKMTLICLSNGTDLIMHDCLFSVLFGYKEMFVTYATSLTCALKQIVL